MRRLSFVVVCHLVAGCGRSEPPRVPDISQPAASRVGLTAAERAEFYHLAEGSEVFPLTWFLALESESGTGLFAEKLDRFGFVLDGAQPSDHSGLPVGITATDTRDLRFAGVKMIGVNCAACHVSEFTLNGKPTRVDGAGGRADISAFYSALAKATVATVKSPLKFLAFLDRARSVESNSHLTDRDARRSATAFQGMPDAGALARGSAFDQALQAARIDAVTQEMLAPTEPLPGWRIVEIAMPGQQSADVMSQISR